MALCFAPHLWSARPVWKSTACVFTRLARLPAMLWRTLMPCMPRFSASADALGPRAVSRGRPLAPARGSAGAVTPLKSP